MRCSFNLRFYAHACWCVKRMCQKKCFAVNLFRLSIHYQRLWMCRHSRTCPSAVSSPQAAYSPVHDACSRYIRYTRVQRTRGTSHTPVGTNIEATEYRENTLHSHASTLCVHSTYPKLVAPHAFDFLFIIACQQMNFLGET